MSVSNLKQTDRITASTGIMTELVPDVYPKEVQAYPLQNEMINQAVVNNSREFSSITETSFAESNYLRRAGLGGSSTSPLDDCDCEITEAQIA